MHLQENDLNPEAQISQGARPDAALGEASLRRWMTMGFSIAVLLTVFTGFSVLRKLFEADQDVGSARLARAVSMNLSATLADVVDSETGARGFALTGEEIFLQPYEAGRRAAAQNLIELRNLTADNAGQQKRLEPWQPQVGAALEILDKIVAERRQHGAVSVAAFEKNKQSVDTVRATEKAIDGQEIGLIRELSGKTAAARRLTRNGTWVGTSAGVVFLVIVWSVVLRQVNATEQARAQVKALNADLEQRIEERTAALKPSEEVLRLLLDGIKDYAVYLLDPEGNVASWNAGAARIQGYSTEEILGKPSSVFHSPAGRADGMPAMDLKAAISMGRFEGQGQRVRKDGTTFWAQVAIHPIYDQKGKLRYFSKVLHDITEQKRIQDALRESEERFQTMVNSIPQLAWMAEADGRIFWYNRRWYEFTGTTPEQMEGSGWQSVHDPGILPRVLENWRGAIETESPFEMEFPLRGANGHFGRFLTRVVPLKGNDGRVIRWFGTDTDISALKEVEARASAQAEDLARSRQTLEEQTRMLKLVLDNMGEGLVAATPEGHFFIWNDAASRLMGRGPEDLPREEWTTYYKMFLPDGVTPYPEDRLPLVRALHGESVQVEMMIRNPQSGSEVFVEAATRPLTDDQGTICGGVVVFSDITERKAAERKVLRLNEELEMRVVERTSQLEVANKELEAFTYSVSHDLRAPLRHISGFSRILTEEFGDSLDPGARHYLDRILEGAHQMGLLVDGLLNLARIGRKALSLRPTNLNSIVAEVKSILEPESEGREVEWAIADLPAVDCDPVLVKQIFQNLLANALKFTRTRARAEIQIECGKANGQHVFTVSDNGVGFNMKYADQLFGVFHRLHQTEDFEGTGIGLATVQRIVHKHGGAVWAEAEADIGAKFLFTLGIAADK